MSTARTLIGFAIIIALAVLVVGPAIESAVAETLELGFGR